jgi:hypothetical protein
MKRSDVDIAQRKMAAYCAEGADYGSQLTCQRKQKLSADNGETKINFDSIETILRNEAGKILQHA